MDVPHMFVVTKYNLADLRYKASEQRFAIEKKLELSHVKYKDKINSLL